MALLGKRVPLNPYEKEQKEYEKMMKTARMAAGFLGGSPMGMDKGNQRKWLNTWQRFLYTKVYFPFKKFFFDLRNYALKSFRDILGPLNEFVDMIISAAQGLLGLVKNIGSVIWKGLRAGVGKIFSILGFTKALRTVKDAILYMTGRLEQKLEEIDDSIKQSNEDAYKRDLRGKKTGVKKSGWEWLIIAALGILIGLLKKFDLSKIFDNLFGRFSGFFEGLLKSLPDIFKGIGLFKFLKDLGLADKILELLGLDKLGTRLAKYIGTVFGEESVIGRAVLKIGGFFSRWFGEESLIGKIAGKAFAVLKFIDNTLFFGVFGKIWGFIGKVLGFAGKILKAIPVIGQIVLVVTSIFDFIEGFSSENALKMFGTDGVFAKVMSGFSYVLSGLTFGLVEPDTIAKMLKVITNGVIWVADKIVWLGEYFVKEIPKIYESVVNIVKEWVPKIKDKFLTILDYFIFWPIKLLDKFLPGLEKDIKDFFSNIGSAISSALWSAFDAIGKFAKDNLGWLGGKIADWFGGGNWSEGLKNFKSPLSPKEAGASVHPTGSLGGTYDSIIKKAAETYGVDPALIKSVIRAESGGDPNALGNKGERGLMQLMPDTAKMLNVSKPFDPEQNIMAGTRYLSDLLKQYKQDLSLALTAYNWGSGNMERQGLDKTPEGTKKYISKVTSYMKEYSKGERVTESEFSKAQKPLPTLSSVAKQEAEIMANAKTEAEKATREEVKRTTGTSQPSNVASAISPQAGQIGSNIPTSIIDSSNVVFLQVSH